MKQETSNPIPVTPGRKVNPKMVTNKNMMVPSGERKERKKTRFGRRKPKKKTQETQVETEQQVNYQTQQPSVTQQRKKPVKRGGARKVSTARADGTKEAPTQAEAQPNPALEKMNVLYSSIGFSITEDELMTEEDKYVIAREYLAIVAEQSTLNFVVQYEEKLLSKIYNEIVAHYQQVVNLVNEGNTEYEEDEEESVDDGFGGEETPTPAPEKQIDEKALNKVLARIKKAGQEMIEKLLGSFLSQDRKYQYFKALMELVNNNPGEDEFISLVHGQFYRFLFSLVNSGMHNVFEGDFISEEEEE